MLLLFGRERGELAGHDVVLGAADGPRLELGHLGDEDGGRLVERATRLQRLLDDGRLLVADLEVGLRRAGQRVGRRGDEPCPLGGSASRRATMRRTVAVSAGRSAASGRPPRSARTAVSRAGPKIRWNMRESYEASRRRPMSSGPRRR